MQLFIYLFYNKLIKESVRRQIVNIFHSRIKHERVISSSEKPNNKIIKRPNKSFLGIKKEILCPEKAKHTHKHFNSNLTLLFIFSFTPMFGLF